MNERKKLLCYEFGKFLIDIAKLLFAGVMLAGVMKRDEANQPWLYMVTFGFILFCVCLGLLSMSMSKPKNKKENEGTDNL
jgi:hypothetical protein